MATDVAKLYLKDELEERVKNLEAYKKLDIPDHPGWTFMLSPIVKEYGICPFLNVFDPETKQRRLPWLYSQSDKGEFYHQTILTYVNEVTLENLDSEIASVKKKLSAHVKEILCSFEMTDGITHDILIENIKLKKEANSQKRIKTMWDQTIRMFDYIMMNKGIDFSKYVNVAYDMSIRYKAPIITNSIVDKIFVALYENFTANTSKLTNLRNIREKERQTAEQLLSNLVKNEFRLEQSGRYYKKWSALDQERKDERIKSYCEWFIREQNKPLSYADIMYKWVIENVNAETIKISDIKWNSKMGIIENINITMNEQGVMEVGKRAPRILKVKKQQKKKRDEIFQSVEEKGLQQRINRLLLYEMVRTVGVFDKDSIVKSLLKNLGTARKLIPQNNLTDYINWKYVEFLEVLTSHAD